ncbi:hypothetical protein EON65_19475 [archaeon]|nr:MAG: hypothetical protein EON65_19475 [archaeon]
MIMIAQQQPGGVWGSSSGKHSFSSHRLSSTSPCSSPKTTRKNMLNTFINYLIILLNRVEGSHSDTYIFELRDTLCKLALYVPQEPAQTLSERDRRLIQQVESHDYNELKGLLEEIVHKSAKNHNILERELKCDRFITAYCNLKSLNDQMEDVSRQRYQQVKNEIMMDLLDFDHVLCTSFKTFSINIDQAHGLSRHSKTAINAKLFLPTS